MSSLRNSLHRRNHKERSQLSSRSRFGILEKHKDYVLRARDYHSKQDRIHRLKQKAAERNKDEFYFGMARQKTQNGVHIQDRGNVSLPIDMVKVLKTQDENYIRTMRLVGLKKIDKLKAHLMQMANLFDNSVNVDDSEDGNDSDTLNEEDAEILKTAGVLNNESSVRRRRRAKAKKHIIFVDDETEVSKLRQEPQASTSNVLEETKSVDLGWVTDESKADKKSHISLKSDQKETQLQRVESKKNRRRLLKELAARLTRDTQLRYMERELEMQRLLMGKGASKKIRGVEKVENDEEELDEDEQLAREKMKKSERVQKAKEKQVYKPRIYKWRTERKR